MTKSLQKNKNEFFSKKDALIYFVVVVFVVVVVFNCETVAIHVFKLHKKSSIIFVWCYGKAMDLL